jgi:hypothetical protein
VNWSEAIQKTKDKQDQLGCPNIAVFSEIKAERSGKSFSRKGKKGILTHVFLLLGSCPHLSSSLSGAYLPISQQPLTLPPRAGVCRTGRYIPLLIVRQDRFILIIG